MKNRFIAMFMMFLIVTIPLTSLNVVAAENADACIEKHEETSAFVDALDNQLIGMLEVVASIGYMITTVMNAIEEVVVLVSQIIGVGEGCCALPPPICESQGAFYRSWENFYSKFQPLSCFISCGWCSSGGCSQLGSIPLDKITLGAIPAIAEPNVEGVEPSGGIGQFHISPFDNIYTAIGCLCPTAILFNLRKLKTIYQTYDCCVEQSCKYGYSTESCDKFLSVSTCQYWEGSIYKSLVNVALSFVAKFLGNLITEALLDPKTSLGGAVNCVLLIFRVIQLPDLVDQVKGAWDWMQTSFKEPNCEDLGYDNIEVSEQQLNETTQEMLDNLLNQPGFIDVIRPELKIKGKIGYFSTKSVDELRKEGALANVDSKDIFVFDEGTFIKDIPTTEIPDKYPEFNINFNQVSATDIISFMRDNNMDSQQVKGFLDTLGIANFDSAIRKASSADTKFESSLDITDPKNTQLISGINSFLAANKLEMQEYMGYVKRGEVLPVLQDIPKYQEIVNNYKELDKKRSELQALEQELAILSPEKYQQLLQQLQKITDSESTKTVLRDEQQKIFDDLKDQMHLTADQQIEYDKIETQIRTLNSQIANYERTIAASGLNDNYLSNLQGQLDSLKQSISKVNDYKTYLKGLGNSEDAINTLVALDSRSQVVNSLMFTTEEIDGKLGNLAALSSFDLETILSASQKLRAGSGVLSLDLTIPERTVVGLLEASDSQGITEQELKDMLGDPLIAYRIPENANKDNLETFVEIIKRSDFYTNYNKELGLDTKAKQLLADDRQTLDQVVDSRASALDAYTKRGNDMRQKEIQSAELDKIVPNRPQGMDQAEKEISILNSDLQGITSQLKEVNRQLDELKRQGYETPEQLNAKIQELSAKKAQLETEAQQKLDKINELYGTLIEIKIEQLDQFFESIGLSEEWEKWKNKELGLDELIEEIKKKEREFVEQRARKFALKKATYEIAYKLLSKTLGKYAYDVIDKKCEDDWEATDYDTGEDSSTGWDFDCRRSGNTMMTVQAYRSVSGYTYEYSFTVASCKNTVNYKIEFDNMIAEQGRVEKGQSYGNNARVQNPNIFNQICISVDDNSAEKLCSYIFVNANVGT